MQGPRSSGRPLPFSALTDPSKDRWTTVPIPYTGYPQVEPNVVCIEVTSFVRDALHYGHRIVGFNFRVEDELISGTLAEAGVFGN